LAATPVVSQTLDPAATWQGIRLYVNPEQGTECPPHAFEAL